MKPYTIFLSLVRTTSLTIPSAYLDPGTGSYIIQLLVAGLMGILFLVKVYWRKIKGFFTKKGPAVEESDDGE